MGFRVKNLSVSRGGIQLLENVSFEIAEGKALAIRGPNGIGKTSLLRTLVGLQNTTAGSVTPDGDALCYFGHSNSVKLALSVKENLRFWSEIYASDDLALATEALGLGDLLERITGELSAGQMRRVGLARLALSGRKYWIMDEPTVGLDSANRTRLGTLVKGHLGAGGCVIAATHVDLPFPCADLDISQFTASQTNIVGSFDEAFL